MSLSIWKALTDLGIWTAMYMHRAMHMPRVVCVFSKDLEGPLAIG